MFVCIPFILATLISTPIPEVQEPYPILSYTRAHIAPSSPDWFSCDVEAIEVNESNTGEFLFLIKYGGCII